MRIYLATRIFRLTENLGYPRMRVKVTKGHVFGNKIHDQRPLTRLLKDNQRSYKTLRDRWESLATLNWSLALVVSSGLDAERHGCTGA